MKTRSKMIVKVSGVPVIGYNFALQLKSDMYLREAVIKAAETQGFDTKAFPEPTKRNSFKNAMRKQQRMTKDADKVLHFVEESETAVVFQVDRKVLESNSLWGASSDGSNANIEAKSASYQREVQVVYDKSNDRVICDNSEILQAVYRLLNVYQESYTKQTLTRYVLNLLEKNTSFVPYIKGTGVYFVPAHQKAFLTKVIDFLYEVDGVVNTVLCEIPDTPNAKDAIGASTAEKFADLRKDQESEILKFIEESQSMTKVMCDNRINELAQRSRLIEEYEILLGKELKEAKRSVQASERFIKNYHKYGTLENPFQSVVDDAKGKDAALMEVIKENIPDDILELIDFD